MNTITLSGWAWGYIDNTGALVTSGAVAQTCDFFPIVKGATYTIVCDGTTETRFAIYDTGKNFVERLLSTSVYKATVDGYAKITVQPGQIATNAYISTDAEVTEMPTEYSVTVSKTTNGTVRASASTATEGETVTLTITPGEGYQLNTLTVTDANGNIVTVSNSSFTMPASSVTVSATFTETTTDDGSGDSGTATYSVTNRLTNVTTNNSIASVNKNAAYIAMLTAAHGYEMDTVTVTMGGTDVTADVYADGTISIASVTGNVVITAVASETDDGTATTPTVDGKYTLPWLVVQKKNHENALKFIGKKYFSLGDSIVQNDTTRKGYQHYIVERYSMTHHNYGVGGSTVVDMLSTYQKLDFTDVALVTIGFGVNDARTAVPLGEIGNYGDTEHDTTTFYGAYRTLLDKIYTANPECRVILLTPLQRLFVTNFGCDTTNANGNKLIDFVDAIIQIGEMYATPVCDMYRNSGLNQKNLAYYTTEGVHPEDAGYLRMANLILNTMDRF